MKKLLQQSVWAFIIAPIMYLAATWNKIPSRVPMQFNWNGDVNRWGSKSELIAAVLILTAVNVGTYLLLINVHRIDPKKYAIENKQRMKSLAFAISVFISAIIILLVNTAVTGKLNFTPQLIFAGVGILFSIIGNYMYNLKPNYFAGLRLPWTLENEDNWRRTHQLAGKLWFAGGILILVCSLSLPRLAGLIAFGTIIFTLVVIPVVYSYRLFQKQKTMSSQ